MSKEIEFKIPSKKTIAIILIIVSTLLIITLICTYTTIKFSDKYTKSLLDNCIKNNENMYNTCMNYIDENCNVLKLTDRFNDYKKDMQTNWI